MKRGLMGVVAAGAFMGAACGGGGGGTGGGGNPGGGSQITYGSFRIEATSALSAPVVVPTPGYTMLGFGGATITNAVVNFPPVTQVAPEVMFDNSAFAASVNNYPMLVDLFNERAFPLHTSGVSDEDTQPSFYSAGPRILTSEWDPATLCCQIFSVQRDGAGRTRLTSDPNVEYREPVDAWSKGILFTDATGSPSKIKRLPIGTSTLETLYDDGNDYSRPTVSPDGTKLILVRTAGDGTETIVVGSPDGTAPLQDLFTTGAPGRFLLTWLPNGTLLAGIDNSGGTTFYRIDIATGNVGVPGSVAGTYESIAAAPDGITVALSDGSPDIKRLSLNNFHVDDFATMEGPVDGISWSKYDQRKALIGPESWYTSQASGFLVTQQYSRVGSYVTFTATTPSGVTITPQGGDFSHTLVCTVEASDALTSLKFTANGINFYPTTVLTPSNPAKGAIVSFNSDTGTIASVITYSTSSLSGLTRAANGNTLTFKGKFDSVWNGKGENTHPSGVTTVKIDTKTGALLAAE